MTTPARTTFGCTQNTAANGPAIRKEDYIATVVARAKRFRRNVSIGSNAAAAEPNANAAEIVSALLKIQDITTTQLIPISRTKAEILKKSTFP